MAEVELNLQELNVTELLAIATGVASSLQDNVHFTAPTPSPQELQALTAKLLAADEAYRQQRALASDAKIALDRATEELRRALGAEMAYVQKESGGDIAKILSANLHVEEETSFWPFNRMAQVTELAASMGDLPGEVDLAWDPVPNASGYEVEIAYDLNGEGPWEQCGATTQSKITIEKLSNRSRYWFRVRAVGERGAGEWSDAATKYAR
ncbi:MAG: fibronectin type III domain-containing protein [Chthoniobacteraceae bacterium]